MGFSSTIFKMKSKFAKILIFFAKSNYLEDLKNNKSKCANPLNKRLCNNLFSLHPFVIGFPEL